MRPVEPAIRCDCKIKPSANWLRISRDLGSDFARSRARVSRDRGQPFHGSWAGWPTGFIGSVLAVLVKVFRSAHLSSHAFTVEFEAMRVMDEAVEDSIGQSGIADSFVPLIDGQLAGNDCRPSPLSIF